MTTPLTTRIAEFVADDAILDEGQRALARCHILDTLASVVACRDLAPAAVARRYATTNSGGGPATMLGTQQRASLVDAVFAGAMTAHAAEINDFIPSVFVQPGPSIVATALGVAETRRSTGAEVVRAVLVGYELAARIPRALGPKNLRATGLASHGVAPTFGAGATAAALLGLAPERIGDVLSSCAQQASGSWQWLLDVEHIEKAFVFAGMGARNGLQAALLVDAGYRGIPASFDHPAGWFQGEAFRHGDRDEAALTGLRGDALHAMADAAFKRYPVGGPAQPAVAALLELAPLIDPIEIDRVRITMPGRADAFRDAGMPALNLRYLASIILLDGHLDFVAAQSLPRMRGDEAVAAQMATVEVVHDPSQEAGAGRDRVESARVSVTMRDGTVHERFVGHVRGFPTHPMPREDVEAKAFELMAPHLGADRAGTIVERCRRLDELDDAAELVELVAR